MDSPSSPSTSRRPRCPIRRGGRVPHRLRRGLPFVPRSVLESLHVEPRGERQFGRTPDFGNYVNPDGAKSSLKFPRPEPARGRQPWRQSRYLGAPASSAPAVSLSPSERGRAPPEVHPQIAPLRRGGGFTCVARSAVLVERGTRRSAHPHGLQGPRSSPGSGISCQHGVADRQAPWAGHGR